MGTPWSSRAWGLTPRCTGSDPGLSLSSSHSHLQGALAQCGPTRVTSLTHSSLSVSGSYTEILPSPKTFMKILINACKQ